MLINSTTVLVTGGTSGIGLALILQLHSAGHKVIVVARNKTKLAQLQSDYENITVYPCDLALRQQVESLADKLINLHPELSVVFNNAGIQYNPTFIDEAFSYDTIEQEIMVNFLAPVWLTSLLLPQLLNQPQAAVINISSGLALAPKTNSAIYCASKAAIHSFAQSLRYQLEGTTVSSIEAIMPLVDTPMTQGRGSGKLSPEYAAQQIIKGVRSSRTEIYIGKARVLPLLMRLSPSLVKRILKRY